MSLLLAPAVCVHQSQDYCLWDFRIKQKLLFTVWVFVLWLKLFLLWGWWQLLKYRFYSGWIFLCIKCNQPGNLLTHGFLFRAVLAFEPDIFWVQMNSFLCLLLSWSALPYVWSWRTVVYTETTDLLFLSPLYHLLWDSAPPLRGQILPDSTHVSARCHGSRSSPRDIVPTSAVCNIWWVHHQHNFIYITCLKDTTGHRIGV